LQKTKIFGEQTAAARNDVIAKKIASGLFQNLSGRPEDWTVSGPCLSTCQVSGVTTSSESEPGNNVRTSFCFGVRIFRFTDRTGSSFVK